MEDKGWRIEGASILYPRFSILDCPSLHEANRFDVTPQNIDFGGRPKLDRNSVAVERKLLAPEIAPALQLYPDRIGVGGRRANLRYVIRRDNGIALGCVHRKS